VGSAPAGNGFFGQSDLAGNVFEWTLDYDDGGRTSPEPCTDCARTSGGRFRIIRGGCFDSDPQDLLSSSGAFLDPAVRAGRVGARCARTP
jgi:formylglycine-generating enzyme required for sulfatase activity